MRRLTIMLLLAGLVAAGLPGCSGQSSRTQAVFMLVDTSGTYAHQLDKAQSIINYLLAKLYPGDSLAVARIDSASFTQKNILDQVTFDGRPSYAIAQKRNFKRKIDDFVKSVKHGSAYTDITGAVVQAAEYLRETGAPHKTILIFSDLKEDLPKGDVRNFPLHLKGIRVVALNVTKLRSDNVDPRRYRNRVKHWRKRVEEGGGKFVLVNDLSRMDKVLPQQ
ncbi:MAG TPA: VWA domain-containing protein [Gammaproteobacteria bacterium]|nr:VWA domain-containing protein [Gammaproteobacteria bacterium]